MIIKGTALWAYINTPNVKYDPLWTIDLIPDDESELEALEAKGYKIKTGKDGQKAVVIKRKTVKANGSPAMQPKLVDAHKNPIDLAVGNGSKVAVQYEEYAGTNAYGPYQGLDLKGVQVLDLVTFGGADGDEFVSVDPDEEF